MNSIEKQINNHLSLLQNEEHGILVDYLSCLLYTSDAADE